MNTLWAIRSKLLHTCHCQVKPYGSCFGGWQEMPWVSCPVEAKNLTRRPCLHAWRIYPEAECRLLCELSHGYTFGAFYRAVPQSLVHKPHPRARQTPPFSQGRRSISTHRQLCFLCRAVPDRRTSGIIVKRQRPRVLGRECRNSL